MIDKFITFIGGNVTKLLIAGVVLLSVFAGLATAKRHFENVQAEAVRAAVEAAVNQVRGEIATKSAETLKKAQERMQVGLDDVNARNALASKEWNKLLTQTNGIDENAQPAPKLVKKVNKPRANKPDPQLDAINGASADADRMLERASKIPIPAGVSGR